MTFSAEPQRRKDAPPVAVTALAALGYAPLVPWFAVLVGVGDLPAWQATAVLFLLPLVALTFGMAAVHVLLWRGRGFAVFALLVVLSSFCLVGSVVGSAVAPVEASNTAEWTAK